MEVLDAFISTIKITKDNEGKIKVDHVFTWLWDFDGTILYSTITWFCSFSYMWLIKFYFQKIIFESNYDNLGCYYYNEWSKPELFSSNW